MLRPSPPPGLLLATSTSRTTEEEKQIDAEHSTEAMVEDPERKAARQRQKATVEKEKSRLGQWADANEKEAEKIGSLQLWFTLAAMFVTMLVSFLVIRQWVVPFIMGFVTMLVVLAIGKNNINARHKSRIKAMHELRSLASGLALEFETLLAKFGGDPYNKDYLSEFSNMMSRVHSARERINQYLIESDSNGLF